MKTFIKIVSLLFAALLLLVSCAQGGAVATVTVPADDLTGGQPITKTPVSAVARTETPAQTAETPEPAPTETPEELSSAVVTPTPTASPVTETPTETPTGEQARTLDDADLMKTFAPAAVAPKRVDETFTAAARSFALALMQAVGADSRGENIVLSPLSALTCLSMTANGAAGQTKEEMEKVLGGGMTINELNAYLRAYISTLPQEEKCRLILANSIWISEGEDFIASRDFLQTNADYYGAGAYKIPFVDENVHLVNEWVKEKTDGLIDKLLEQFDANVVMLLINAVSFDAEWKTIFSKDEVIRGTFNAYDGTKQKATFLCGEDNVRFFADGDVTEEERFSGRYSSTVGFIKSYAGGRYGFAVILPNAQTDVYDYLAALAPEKLTALLAGGQNAYMSAMMPKFTSDFTVELNDALSSMGMPTAFDSGAADFSALGDPSLDLYLTKVGQRAVITVDERGTKASAVTEAAPGYKGMSESVIVDRPFIYMIVDLETNIPVFVGVTAEV